MFQPYISDHDFTSSIIGVDNFGYNLYVCDLRKQQNFTASQQIKLEFKFDRVVPSDVIGYALVLAKEISVFEL